MYTLHYITFSPGYYRTVDFNDYKPNSSNLELSTLLSYSPLNVC